MLQDFDSAHFLQHYWQQQYGVFRNAVPDAASLLSADELAGLALEDCVESRLISGTEALVQHGPFSEEQLQQFPAENASLLVQAVDHYLPQINELREAFGFLPSWRVDDVMISFASNNGGVGPHYDHYDVFLIQGQGQREWRLGPRIEDDQGQRSAGGLHLLAPYSPTDTFTLQPGDMLYIPAGFAHWGISSGDSLCLSVGFRAPALHEILQQWAADTADTLSDKLRYQDPSASHHDRYELPANNLQQIHQLLQDKLTPQALADATARLVSEPKYEHAVDPARLQEASPQTLYKTPDCRMLISNNRLFANGHVLQGSAEHDVDTLIALCDSDSITPEFQEKLLKTAQGKLLLQELLNYAVFDTNADLDE